MTPAASVAIGPAGGRVDETPTVTDSETVPRNPEMVRQVVPLLQRALDDPALEVVVAAAEDLGTLGVPEAGPVLTGLLQHPSEPVRQTAAQDYKLQALILGIVHSAPFQQRRGEKMVQEIAKK